MVSKKFFLLIQARIKSSRLPGKVLFNFFNKTIFERILDIGINIVGNKKDVHVLLGEKEDCLILADICKLYNISYNFCKPGKEYSPYLRFKDFVKKNRKKIDFFIRITSDNYLIQPKILKHMINDFKKNNYDYSYIKPLSHFSGEIVKTETFLNIKKLNANVIEHVTYSIRNNKHLKIKSYNKNFYNLNHTKKIALDNKEDLIFMKKLEKKYPNLKKLNCLKTLKKITNKSQ